MDHSSFIRRHGWFMLAFVLSLMLGAFAGPELGNWWAAHGHQQSDSFRRYEERAQVATCTGMIISASQETLRWVMHSDLRHAVSCIEKHRSLCKDEKLPDFDARLDRLRDARDELDLRPAQMTDEQLNEVMSRLQRSILIEGVTPAEIKTPIVCYAYKED